MVICSPTLFEFAYSMFINEQQAVSLFISGLKFELKNVR